MRRPLFLILLLCAGAALAESSTVLRDIELKKEPFNDAAGVGQLKQNAVVDVLLRKGAWLQVKAGELSGWLRLLAVRSTASGKAGESGVNQAFNVARTGASGSAVATGVRGLSKEQIENAQPNPAELAKLDGFAATESQAREFGHEPPGLAEQQVGYLESGDGK
jgi:hypothetical protein